MLNNLFKCDNQIERITFSRHKQQIGLCFYRDFAIKFYFFDNTDTTEWIYLYNIRDKDKKRLYKYVMYHFFGKGVRVPYKAISRDVPIKSLRY